MSDPDVQLPGTLSDAPSSTSMEAFHATIAGISSAMGNLLYNSVASPFAGTSSTTVASPPPCSDLNLSVNSDEHSDVSQAIPGTLIKEQWQVILGQDATPDDLKNAIERCKQLVISTEQMSAERQWLVRHLVELRFRLTEIEDSVNNPSKSGTKTQVRPLFLSRIIEATLCASEFLQSECLISGRFGASLCGSTHPDSDA